MVYPTGVTLRVRLVKQGKSIARDRFHVVYEESFEKTEANDEMMEYTFEMLEPLLEGVGLKLLRGKRFFRMSGTVSREIVGDMMVGEFMHWSTVGSMPLRKIFETASVGRVLGTKAMMDRAAGRAGGAGRAGRAGKPQASSPKSSS